MTWPLVAVAAISLIGGYVGGMTGFGFALVIVPVISLATNPHAAVGAGLMLGAVCSLAMAYGDRAHFRWEPAWLLWGSAFIAMPVGVLISRVAPTAVLQVMIGVAVLVSTAALLRGLRIRRRRSGLVAAGTISGLLATSTGMHGPPVVIACDAVGLETAEVRSTAAGVIGVQALVAVATATFGGMFDARTLQVVGIAAVPTAVGWWAGATAFAGLNPVVVQRSTYLLLVISGVFSIWTGLRGG